MIDLEPISDYLVEPPEVLHECDELGFVGSKGYAFLSFASSEEFLEEASSNMAIKAVLWDAEKEVQASKYPFRIIRCRKPMLAFFALHNSLDSAPRGFPTEVSPEAYVHPSCEISQVGVRIGPGVVVEPFVTIYAGTTIGANSVIRSGSRIGGDALDIKSRGDGTYQMSKHQGLLSIGEGVEIGHNSVVDRALFRHQVTTIGDQCKIACLCNISHGVVLGKRNKVAAGVNICGSTTLGDDNWIGPSATISHLLTIGSGVYITMGSVVLQDLSDGWKVVGSKIFRDKKLF